MKQYLQENKAEKSTLTCDTRQMDRKNSYTREELIICAKGKMFGEGNAQLPLHPMLMFDRIVDINEDGGDFSKGQIIAELDVKPEHWFFACHFYNDPVMPGCLGLDAMWQLVGFFLGWMGAPGRGRALGAGEVKFKGQVTPENRLITYNINMKRVVLRKLKMGVANAHMEVDGKVIYFAKDLRVGLFESTEGF